MNSFRGMSKKETKRVMRSCFPLSDENAQRIIDKNVLWSCFRFSESALAPVWLRLPHRVIFEDGERLCYFLVRTEELLGVPLLEEFFSMTLQHWLMSTNSRVLSRHPLVQRLAAKRRELCSKPSRDPHLDAELKGLDLLKLNLEDLKSFSDTYHNRQ